MSNSMEKSVPNLGRSGGGNGWGLVGALEMQQNYRLATFLDRNRRHQDEHTRGQNKSQTLI